MIKNLTPHCINIVNDRGETLRTFESDGVCRCSQSTEPSEELEGIPTSVTRYGDVAGLPSEEEGTFYIVSGLVKAALPSRKDLLVPTSMLLELPDGSFVPAEKCKDKTGSKIRGCLALGR